MTEEIMKLWCPISKSADGSFVGILSDTSMDRDEEFMSKELLQDWAVKNVVLPALANHQNKMESFIGGWTDLKVVEKNGHSALVAKPFFFSKEANPLAAQIEKQISEAVDKGLNPGISIGAIPKESMKKDIDGKQFTVFTKAELLEATFVPIQSNRNASFGHIAKEFDIMEVNKMTEEIKKEESPAPVEETPKVEEAPAEEVKEEPVAESREEVSDKEVEEVVEESLKDIKAELEKTKAELESLKKKAVLKATVEGPAVEVKKEPTMENMLGLKYGGRQ